MQSLFIIGFHFLQIPKNLGLKVTMPGTALLATWDRGAGTPFGAQLALEYTIELVWESNTKFWGSSARFVR